MKILINASNIRFGGALQVAISLISSLIKNDRGHEFCFIVSCNIKEQLFFNESDNVFSIDLKASSLLSLIKSRHQLDAITFDFDPDLVFTIFGPAYWRPRRVKHLVGFANAWIVTPDSVAFKKMGILRRNLTRIKYWFLGLLLYNKNDFYVTETKVIKELFCKRFKAEPNRVDVVSNGLPYFFNNAELNNVEKRFDFDGFKFLTVSHNYVHKNLDIIPKVGKELDLMNLSFKFVVTFDDDTYESMPEDFKSYTINAGVVKNKDCKSLYMSCQALFLPTLIECFTVSYLEAMETRKPIATSNLPFAHDICGDSAYYFDPLNIQSVALVCADIIKGYGDEAMIKRLNNYEKKLNCFPSPEEKVDCYLACIEKIIME
ncbi:glycosyltransferase family 1 protein [Vibrio harveyi]|uniref:glycosyltransferase family 1 protein n=1 Tax=Vibrio harveyi TaxID=669 RepID=UPI000C7B06AF|nr:glycosyltransferase family 1 protein [Vibrio harveyi]